ncbi:succinyl-diaminopimelate desuccinylase [Legionella impletisoli]|uniref:Succinyl-diaminopimelate desuccinylase n=1 Tax=Legionella impletisoli TaxID=343510 RepID=A0A917NBL4_9GAMM|nr:succinyl-diaminopimelate desuccinylase [Legionella impletisoli]GGI81174.1 succinyl-diaminopimelate desuccinylase [Legionella impletisoli]
MSSVKDLLARLIRFESVTPYDDGCQPFMMDYLQELGFTCTPLNNHPVSNFYAQIGEDKPLFLFAGHTDVVSVGETNKWDTNPFELVERNGLLFGRGAADMKGSLAAMLLATKRFLENHSEFKGALGFLITSGEEGEEFELGTPHVMRTLAQKNIIPDYCIVGEPSSTKYIGDVVKIGRRGSLTGRMILQGKQGHVAYPHLAENPIHTLSPLLTELVSTKWDKGNDYFPPTTLQITHIEAGGIGSNIIPGELKLQFNFRFSTEHTADSLMKTVEDCFSRHHLNPEIRWQLNGEPFLTAQGKLVDATVSAIRKITTLEPQLSTSGGTSDARFIAPFGVEVIELGPVNATIHQVNECVSIAELEILTDLYYAICVDLLT